MGQAEIGDVAQGAIGRRRSRLGLLALAAALVTIFALALPGSAAAAKYTLTVKKTGTVGTSTVKCEVAGSGVIGTCASSYLEETELVLYATPSAGLIFAGWQDPSCSFYEAEPCELRMEEPVTVVAEFGPIPKYPLTIEMEGSGSGTVKCEVAGSGSAGTCASAYPAGTELNLYAVANPGSEFVEWTGACANASCDLTIEEEEVTVTAIFKARPQVPFSVVKSGTGAGTVTCDGGACASSYSEGKEVTLVATAATGSTFAGWSGGGCSGTGSCKVTIKAGITVTATFNLNPLSTPELEGKARAAGSAPVRGRNAALKLTCSGGPCKGALKLSAKIRQGQTVKRVVLGRTSFSLPAGAARTLTVRLSLAAKKELDKRGSLKARLAGTGVTGSTVRLKLRR